MEASDNFHAAMESVVEAKAEPVSSGEILTEGAVVTDGNGERFSIRSMKHDIAQGKMFEDIRKIAPDHFLLVPGVGAQGGSLEDVCQYGMTKDSGLIVNSSRAIIYADKTENFAVVAGQEAKKVQEQMAEQLKAIL